MHAANRGARGLGDAKGNDLKKILFVDTGREYGGGTKSFLYLLRGLAAQQKYELCAFFETDYEAGGRKISQIIEEAGAKFINVAPKKQPSKLKKELLRALGGQILAKYLYKKDYDYALCLLGQVRPDILHLNNHFSTNLAYIAAANALNIAVVQHLRKNSAVEPFKLEILRRLNFTPVCVSNATYEFYAAQIKMPKNVVYNPVEAPVLAGRYAENLQREEISDTWRSDKNLRSAFAEIAADTHHGDVFNSALKALAQGDYDSGSSDKICAKFDGSKASGAGQICADTSEASKICGKKNTNGEAAFKPQICEIKQNLGEKAEVKANSDALNSCDKNRADLDFAKTNSPFQTEESSDLQLANLSSYKDRKKVKFGGQNAAKKEPCELNLISRQANLIAAKNDKAACKNANLKAKFDAEKINIVMPANFLTLKGHELVFDALAGLKRSDIKAYFAGGGELKAGAKAKFDALIRSGKAEYLGFVSKMDEIYAACDYVLGFSSDEGLPRVVIEALGCGLGVVYSDIAVIREIYEISSKKQDFFIVQRSSDALLACFESLRKPASKSPDDAVIKAFSIENYLRGIDRIYSEL